MMETREHDLKTWTLYFSYVADGRKTFEIRYNDRGFAVGDTLRLREYDAKKGEYSGREVTRVVSYITSYMQQDGYIVMGLADADEEGGE